MNISVLCLIKYRNQQLRLWNRFEKLNCVFTWVSSVLEFESLYLENLPSSETYERSYMHRDVVSHVVVTKTDFVITASQDGHLKFWKKQVQ